MSQPTPPLHAEVREAVKNLLFRPVHIDHQNIMPNSITITAEGVDYYTDEILKAVADALLSAMPEKHNKKWDEEHGFCTNCGAWIDDEEFQCYCDIRNNTLDAVTRVIGELGGRRNPDHSESA